MADGKSSRTGHTKAGRAEHESGVGESPGKRVFDDVYFAIIPSKDLDDEKIKELTADLVDHGATHCPLSSSKLRRVTHLISTTSDFPAFHDATEAFIHVVKPDWVQHSILKKKAANPRNHSPDPRLFLSDVVLTFADDIPQGDKDAIIGGLIAMGGNYSSHLTQLVTHIIALTTESPACKLALTRKLRAKPVLPHWFDDCLKLGKKINYEPYLLPDPPIFSTDPVKTPSKFITPDTITGASYRNPPEPTSFVPVSPSKERRELAIFRNLKVMLHPDLDLSDHLRKSILEVIEQGDGTLTSAVDKADILICQYRGSREFKLALKSGIDVGNLSWLYYMINHNIWTDPTRRLLHYPFPKDGIGGFKDFKIAISNYTGDARVYVESLIKAAGGKYTKTMSQENTHLITAQIGSEKSTAASEWGIHMVNHLWLEETYAQGRVLSVTIPRYTTFPRQTNLCEVVGHTQIDRQIIQRKYNPEDDDAVAGEEEDAEESKSTRSPATARSKPTSAQKNLQTPLPSRFKDRVETPSSRGAKDRAMSKLHAMAPDIALYEKETKRVGGVVYGGRRVTDPDRITLNVVPGRKRSSSAAEIVVDEDVLTEKSASPLPQRTKKLKPSAAEPAPITSEPRLRVLITGVDKEGNNKTSVLRTKLRGLKVQLLEDLTSDIDVIAAPRLMRTMKFLAGIAAAPIIVNSKWLDDMGEQKKRLPLEDYLLHDREYEENFSFSLAKALERARKNKLAGGMLKDWTIFCTEGAKGGLSTQEQIIKVNNGKCLLFKGRDTTVVKAKDKNKENIPGNPSLVDGSGGDAAEGKSRDNNGPDYLYMITDEKDKFLWPKFQTMALNQGFEARLAKPDWLLRIALNQDTDEWREEWELGN